MRQSWSGLIRMLLRSPSRSIPTRLFLLLIGIVCFSVVGVGVFASSQASTAIVEMAIENAGQTMALGGEKLDLKLQMYQDMSKELMNNIVFMNHIFQITNDTIKAEELQKRIEEIQDLLDQLALSDARIRDITLIPMEDNIAPISTLREGLAIDDEAAWVRHVMEAGGRDVWLPLAVQGYVVQSAKPVVAYAKRIGKQNLGSHEFILIVQIDAEVLDEMLDGMQISPTSEISLLDRDGIRLWSNREDGTELAGAIMADHADKGMASSDGLVEAGSYIMKADGSGTSLLVAYRHSQLSDWTIVGLADLQELTSAADRIRLVTMLAVVASVAVAIALGLWLTGMIGLPLGQMQQLMEQGAGGRLSGRMRVRGKDEIGQVAIAYNRMMQQIGELIMDARVAVTEVADGGRQFADAADATAGSAQEIQSASEQIAGGAVQLAASAEYGNDLVQQVSRSLTEASDRQMRMAALAREAGETGKLGGQSVEGLLSRTSETERGFLQVQQSIERLNHSAGSLDGILQMLQKISRQTKMLAFNASIEAARAGAAGGGFDVIVKEIHRMSEQTDEALREAGNLTTGIDGEIIATAESIAQAMPIFGHMIEDVHAVTGAFLQIEERMEALINRSAEVTDLLGELSGKQSSLVVAMNEVSAVAEQSTAAAEEVASQCSAQADVSAGMRLQLRNIQSVIAKLEDRMVKFEL